MADGRAFEPYRRTARRRGVRAMKQTVEIRFPELLLALSDALELASPELSQHQMRTAFIAWQLGRATGLEEPLVRRLFWAALLHDAGALSPEEKIDIHRAETVDWERHCDLGAALIARVPFLSDCAPVILHHHRPWSQWEGDESMESRLSRMLFLADEVERAVDRNTYILLQRDGIARRLKEWSGTRHEPYLVEAFRSVAAREGFWLELVSSRLFVHLQEQGPGHDLVLGRGDLLAISELFRNLIDFRSPFTATHSAGVSAAASRLAHHAGFDAADVELMTVAGNLHDLGKMAVTTNILMKPGSLTETETAYMRQHSYHTHAVLSPIKGLGRIPGWAAHHHERIDGTGYPFRLKGSALDTGSRLMAVADIFTALAEDRPYRKGMAQSEVLNILRTMAVRNSLDASAVALLERNYPDVEHAARNRQAAVQQDFRQMRAGRDPV